MIVVCPSCSRRYRHDARDEASPALVRCGACDERFAPAPARRSYRVLAAACAAPVGTSRPVPSAVEGGGAPRTSPGTADPTPGPSLPHEMELALPPAAEIDLAPVPDESPAPAAAVVGAPVEAAAPGSIPAAVTEAPGRSAGRAAGGRSRALWDGLVALVPCGLGAALAYHYAPPLGQDPLTWGALGGAIGLLFGWACLLWITRGD